MTHSRSSVLALRCAPLPLVRIGFVGLGRRGLATLRRYQYIAGVQVTALADLSEDAVSAAFKVLQEWQNDDGSVLYAAQTEEVAETMVESYAGEDAALQLIRSAKVDVVYICTDWTSHTPLAIEAMRSGKHVAVEVPAATTIEDCWRLVQTAEATQRHYL